MRTRSGTMVLVAASVALLGGCGSDGGPEVATDRPGATTTTTRPADPLVAAGEPMVDDLVVPLGTGLAGVITDPYLVTEQPAGAGDPWTAYLAVSGDPFAAWDDLAGQLQEAGIPLAGTADACLWTLAQPEPEEGLPSAEAAGPAEEVGATDGDDEEAAYFREERERLEALFVDADPPPATTIGVSCFATATGEVDGVATQYEASLTATDEVPPTLQLTRSSATFGGELHTTSQVTSSLQQLQGAEQEEREPRPDPVPPGAVDRLPTPAAQPTAAVGDEFGVDVNCFDDGYLPFHLPAGTTLVADGFDGFSASVLALDDPARLEDVLADLEGQAAGDDPSTDFVSDRREAQLDGRPVVQVAVSVEAGGGSCAFTSSPDRSRLLVQRASD